MEDSFVVIAGKPTITKDPNAVLDYYLDFTNWVPAGDTINVITTTATGITVDSSAVTGAGKFIQLWCSAGAAGTLANVIVRVTTVGGRTDDRTVYFKMKQR